MINNGLLSIRQDKTDDNNINLTFKSLFIEFIEVIVLWDLAEVTGVGEITLFVAYGTLRNETKWNGTLRNGTLRNGYNTMLHHTLSRVPRIPLKAEDLFPKSNVLPDAIVDLGDLESCVWTILVSSL